MMNDTMFRMFDLAQKDYCCSQILMCLALECQGRSNGDLVRSMAGLCHGLGHSGDICGALSGGACVLALYAGKGSDSEEGDERLPLMVADLMEWFREYVGSTYGGIKCSDIAGQECVPEIGRCGAVVSETYATVNQILQNYHIDPSSGRTQDA